MSASLGVSVFPSKNQTPEQQRRDESDCFAWSRQQTGIDPMAPPPQVDAQAAAAAAPKGAAARGAAKGAVVGAVFGVRPGSAAVGAAAGAVGGAAKQGQIDQAAVKKAEAQAAAQQQARLDTFKRGFGACLEGKGYTVK
jgi:hypothetical protein